MNPFFLLLLVCTIIALVFWFKNASTKQGITALKVLLIIIGIIIIALVATARLPTLAAIPIVLLAIFKQFAMTKLLIPFIRLLAGSQKARSASAKMITMNDELAIKLLALSANPTREQIVQAHRQKVRDLKQQNTVDDVEITKLDRAREHLINKQEHS
ncbi:hypothetical protein WN093_15060 [Gammaproteobacteria bacterium AS21]|jgi:hypothetical protein